MVSTTVNKWVEAIRDAIFEEMQRDPAVFIIGLFGVFPVFFGMYMSLHKWKVFKGRFLGFENYERILGSIPAFFVFILGLLILIFSYWVWSEFKDKFKQKMYVVFFFTYYLGYWSLLDKH